VKKGPGLLDTGPLVSFLGSGLRHHSWTCAQWKFYRPPLLTCEPVLTEAAFLLKREGCDADPLFALLERGAIRIALDVQEEQADLRTLMRRYRNRPMSLADACMVRLSEIEPAGEIFTLDSDFRIYRRHGNRVIPVLMPD
jgi:predicted nucleic acid-binding protein